MFSLTLWRLGLDNLSVFEVTMYEACVVRSVEEVLYRPYLSMKRERKLLAITQNEPSPRGIDLFYAAVAILSAVPDFVLDKGDLSMKTRLPGRKIGVPRRKWSLSNLYRCCII